MEKETIIVISSYPPKGTTYGKGVGGVASFTKNSMMPIAKNKKVVVLAEIIDKQETYQEEGITVMRCWKRNSLLTYWQLWKNIRSLDKNSNVLFQFEFAQFGDLLVTSVLPVLMIILRLSGYKVFTVIHQVLTDLKSLSGHLGLAKNSPRLKFFSLGLCLYFWLLALANTRVIVLGKEFSRRLTNLGIPENKIKIMLHGVDTQLQVVDKDYAREKIGISKKEKVILVFGFLTWYKGADLIVKAFNKLSGSNFRLVLAGGPSFTLSGKKHYQHYLQKLYALTKINPKVTVTGFVKEENIGYYYSAADLVVLPYRTFMSSSGPLSLALSFGKPVLLSLPLKRWFANGQAKFLSKAHFFKPDVDSLASTLKQTINDKNILKELTENSAQIRSQRDYNLLVKDYLEIFSNEKVSGNFSDRISLAGSFTN